MNLLSTLGVPEISANSLTGMIEGSPYSLAITIAAAAVSLLLCFFGYRLLKVFCALGSFAAGGVLCAWLVSTLFGGSISEQTLPIVTGVSFLIGGLLFAYVLFFLYKLVVFVLFAAIGATVGSVPVVAFSLSGWEMAAVLAGCAVLFGLAGLLFMRPLIILVTACSGFSAASLLVGLTPLGTMDYASMVIIVLGAVLTVLGAVVQFRTVPSGALPGLNKKEHKSEIPDTLTDSADAAAAPAPKEKHSRRRGKRAETIDSDAEYLVREGLTTPAEFFGASLRRSFILRPLLKASPILLLLICILLALSGEPHVEFALIPFIFTYAAQSFGVLTLSSAVLLVRSVPSLIHAMDAGDVLSTVFCGISMLVYLTMTLWALSAFIGNKTGKAFVARLAPSEPADEAAEASVRPADEPTAVLPNDAPTAPAADEPYTMPAETPTAPTRAETAASDDLLSQVHAAIQAQIPSEPGSARTAPMSLEDTAVLPSESKTVSMPASETPDDSDETMVIPSAQTTDAPVHAPEDTVTVPLTDASDDGATETSDDTITLGNPADLK